MSIGTDGSDCRFIMNLYRSFQFCPQREIFFEFFFWGIFVRGVQGGRRPTVLASFAPVPGATALRSALLEALPIAEVEDR